MEQEREPAGKVQIDRSKVLAGHQERREGIRQLHSVFRERVATLGLYVDPRFFDELQALYPRELEGLPMEDHAEAIDRHDRKLAGMLVEAFLHSDSTVLQVSETRARALAVVAEVGRVPVFAGIARKILLDDYIPKNVPNAIEDARAALQPIDPSAVVDAYRREKQFAMRREDAKIREIECNRQMPTGGSAVVTPLTDDPNWNLMGGMPRAPGPTHIRLSD